MVLEVSPGVKKSNLAHSRGQNTCTLWAFRLIDIKSGNFLEKIGG
jgi:hypothetical protein